MRAEINWQYHLPKALSLQPLGATLQVNWQGGVLQASDDLVWWNDVPGAAPPYFHNPASSPNRYWRLRR